jgi:hypothetical protein
LKRLSAFLTDEPLHIAPALSGQSPNVIVCRASFSSRDHDGRQTVKLTPSSSAEAWRVDMRRLRPSQWTEPSAYPFINLDLSKSGRANGNPSRHILSATSCPCLRFSPPAKETSAAGGGLHRRARDGAQAKKTSQRQNLFARRPAAHPVAGRSGTRRRARAQRHPSRTATIVA